MRTVSILLLVAAAATAQVTIEDYKCQSATPAAGNPTVVTCNEPHGFDGAYAQTVALFDNTIADGHTVSMDGITYTFRRAIDNSAPRQVLIGANAPATAQNFLDAVNDSGNGKGVTYSAPTTAHPTVMATSVNNYQTYVVAQMPGVAGMSIALTSSDRNRVQWATIDQRRALNNMAIQWYVMLSGGSGSWAAISNNGGIWNALYVSPTQFSIGLDSRSFGSYSGAPLALRRGSGNGSAFQYINGDYTPLETDGFRTGMYALTAPGCSNALADEVQCTAGYDSPDNQKGYYNAGGVTITSFDVDATGVATITLSGVFQDAPTYPVLAVGQLIFLRGVNDVATMSVGSFRGYAVRSLTTAGKRTQLTIATTLPAGSYPTTNGTVRITWHSTPDWWTQPRLSGGFVWPMGFVWFQSKNPAAMNPRSNRHRMWIKWGKNNHYDPASALDTINWGTYPIPANGTQVHFYHLLTSNSYAGQWQKFEWTAAPDHEVGADPSILWPNDPLNGQGHPFQPYWRGGPRNYMLAQTTWYIDMNSNGLDYSGQTLLIPPAEFDYAAGEPEELVRSRTILYSPMRFIDGGLTANPGYEASWGSVPRTGYSYEVRMSTAGSLKTLGFSTGLCHNGTTSCDVTDIVKPLRSPTYIPCLWQSSTVSNQAPSVWVGIRPTIPIFGMSGSGQSPIWVITEADYGIDAGDRMTVAGVGGNAAANQTAAATVAVQPRQVWFLHSPDPKGGVTWTLPGVLTGITAQSGVCTASLAGAHSLQPGWKVMVTGSANAQLGGSSTKDYTVTATPSSSSFQFSCPSVPDATYAEDGGGGLHLVIMSYPGFALPGTGSGDWDGVSGKVTAADDYKNFAEIQLSPYPERTRSKPLRPRLANAGSGEAILLYTAGDASACKTTVSDLTNAAREFTDGGGMRDRALVVTGLAAASQYSYSVDCGDGSGGDGTFQTAAAGDTAPHHVAVVATRPAQGAADNLVIEYGGAEASLTEHVAVACSSGACIADLTTPGDSTIWLRRRWCKNRAADASCADPANELSRSLATPVIVR